MFESPLEWCTMCRDWVALDQSLEEHARERGCRCSREACPLAALFRPSRDLTAGARVAREPAAS